MGRSGGQVSAHSERKKSFNTGLAVGDKAPARIKKETSPACLGREEQFVWALKSRGKARRESALAADGPIRLSSRMTEKGGKRSEKLSPTCNRARSQPRGER